MSKGHHFLAPEEGFSLKPNTTNQTGLGKAETESQGENKAAFRWRLAGCRLIVSISCSHRLCDKNRNDCPSSAAVFLGR